MVRKETRQTFIALGLCVAIAGSGICLRSKYDSKVVVPAQTSNVCSNKINGFVKTLNSTNIAERAEMIRFDFDGDGRVNEFYRVCKDGKKEVYVNSWGVYADLNLAEIIDYSVMEQGAQRYTNEVDLQNFYVPRVAFLEARHKNLKAKLAELNK